VKSQTPQGIAVFLRFWGKVLQEGSVPFFRITIQFPCLTGTDPGVTQKGNKKGTEIYFNWLPSLPLNISSTSFFMFTSISRILFMVQILFHSQAQNDKRIFTQFIEILDNVEITSQEGGRSEAPQMSERDIYLERLSRID